MKRQARPAVVLRATVLGLAATLLAACAPFQSLLRKPAPPVAVEPPPPPQDPLGVATSRFEFDPAKEDVVGVVQTTVVGQDDTLPDIARRFNLGYEEIVRANPGVDPWVPPVGKTVVLPTRFVLPDAPREGLVVNLAAMRLFWYPKREAGKPQVVYTYPIGIGRVGWVTPEGTTKVVSRTKDPEWRPPASVKKEHLENGEVLPDVVPAGPDNPLGAHMFRLGWPGYLVHGTNKPYGVGMRSSHGCLRLYPEDIAHLFDNMPLGTKVTVVNQPLVVGWHDGVLHAQAYEVLEDDKRDWTHAPRALRKRAPKGSLVWKQIRARDAEIDWEAAHQVALKPSGVPMPVMKAAPTQLATLVAAAPRVRNAVPPGGNWNGKLELRIDEAEYNQMVSEIQGNTPPAPAGSAPAAAATPAAPAAPAGKPAPASR